MSDRTTAALARAINRVVVRYAEKPAAGFRGSFGPLPGAGEGEHLPESAGGPKLPSTGTTTGTTFSPKPPRTPGLGATLPKAPKPAAVPSAGVATGGAHPLDQPAAPSTWNPGGLPYRPPTAGGRAGVTAGSQSGQVVISPGGNVSGDLRASAGLRAGAPASPPKPFVSPQRRRAQEIARQRQEQQQKATTGRIADAINRQSGLGLDGSPRAANAANVAMPDTRDLIDPGTGRRDDRGRPGTNRPAGVDAPTSDTPVTGPGGSTVLRGHGFHPPVEAGQNTPLAAGVGTGLGLASLVGRKGTGALLRPVAGRTLGRAAGSVLGGPVGLGLSLGSMAPSAGHKDTHGLNGMSDDEIERELAETRDREKDSGPRIRSGVRTLRDNLASAGAGVYDAINWGQRQFTGQNFPHDDTRSRLTALEEELAKRRAERGGPARQSRSLAAALGHESAVRRCARGASPLLDRLLDVLSRIPEPALRGINIYFRPDAVTVWIEALPGADPAVARRVELEAVRLFGRDRVTLDDTFRPAGGQWVDVREIGETAPVAGH